MDRKHLSTLIKFSQNASYADQIIRYNTDLETVQEKLAFLKGMFDCLDDVEPIEPVEECYKQYLEHIIAVSNQEENISITQEFHVTVNYVRTNRHGTKIFSVYVDHKHFATCYLSSRNTVKFEITNGDGMSGKLKKQILEAYPVERLQRLSLQK